MINEARAEYNKVIPRAKGEAQQTVLEAEGYALNRVNRAQGESARFRAVQQAYQRAPEVTRRRLYLETMERVIPATGGRVFSTRGQATSFRCCHSMAFASSRSRNRPRGRRREVENDHP